MDMCNFGIPVYSTTRRMNRTLSYPLIIVRNKANRTCLFVNKEDIKDLTLPLINITLNSCSMWKYTFGNTALQKWLLKM